MSSFTFNNIRKNYLVIRQGWTRPAWAPIKRTLLETPNYPGARLLNTQTEIRVLHVPVGIVAREMDLQKVKEDLAGWLITEEEKELVFDTEPDRTYLAVIEDGFDPEELVTLGQGVLKFICPMPYKLGATQKHVFEQQWSTETTSYFKNKGSVEAPPLIEIEAIKPSTFLDIWYGAYPHDRNYFRIGYPQTIQEKVIQERERVMWDDMSKVVGWTPVTGQFAEMEGTGKLKVRDGTALYCPDYGPEGTKEFHGALAKKNIPGGPIQDFEMEAWVHLQSKGVEEMGRVEVLLLDEGSEIVARINMNDLYWNAEITKAYMRIGNQGTPNSLRKLVDTSGSYANTFNNFYGKLRIARRGNQWSVYVARFRDGTEIDDASLVERWTDANNSNPMTQRKIAQVMIAICRWDTNKPVDIMQIDDLKIWKLNKVPDNTKPYIFETGDKIVVDTERSLVTINGKSAINLKDIFSDFPKVICGENRFDIRPPDVKATVSFRERYR
ncbi:phage tail protein [Bacillus anthracis]|nr:phage tail protein [Bacillus anthracis]